MGRVLSLLFLSLAILPAASNIKTAQAQITYKYELVATIHPPSQMTSGTTLSELNFTTDYEVSLLLSFSQDTNLIIPQGTISPPITHQPINASIHDNLGNSFVPIINDTMITNPLIDNIPVPAFFHYAITLFFKTINDPTFHNEIGSFAWTYGANQISAPLSITLRLPNDYTPLSYANGSSKTADYSYTMFNWDFAQGDNISCFVVFNPFSIEPIVRSMAITFEPQTNSPSSASIQIFSMTYDLAGTVMIWNVSLVMPINIPFPDNVSGTEVQSVYDGQGKCEFHTETLNPVTSAVLGKYNVNNNVVSLYPRNTYSGSTQKFDVTITFFVPNNSSNESLKPNIPFWQPYTGYSGIAFNFRDSPMLHLNLTDYFNVTFVFPADTGDFSSPNGERLVLGKVDGQQAVFYDYNSPITLPRTQWVVLFDTLSLKDFYIFAWINNLFLGIAVAILGVTIKRKAFQNEIVFPKSVSVGVLLLLFTAISTNSGEFLFLPWFPMFITFSWILEISLSGIVILLLWLFFRKGKALRKLRNQPEFEITVPVKMLNQNGTSNSD